ncbi:MAG: bifunctional oligoribonuclease/PAP phosphatase NrnA [Lewinellaceae bacterium]|nr:bifunctional oligoribonuclease/PAP phosphatase NrnA [Lewinella sp.]MCB9278665.1 bifunctional oligoribonuclease/PAP phosphatase NrnA [Lewinellaceae bacterium]
MDFFANDIKPVLATPKNVVITSHRNPDGDAIGSSLGLYHFLRGLGHFVTVIVPSEYPDFLDWMPDVTKIIVFDNQPEESQAAIEQADLFFFLDFNDLERIDKLGEMIAPRKGTRIMIDHHLYPENCADFIISDPDASSTSEMVYDFISALGFRSKVDKIIAECIYTGIVTDTGSFKYATSSKLFRTVADLLEFGVDDYLLQDLIFNCMSVKQLRLLGHCLHNRMEILEEYQTGIIALTKEDYANFEIQRGDTEGIVNYLLKLKNVKLAAFITEQPTIVKLSLRSKGDFSVQEIAKKHFKGGGHKNAAGGYSFQGLKTTVRKFKEILPEYRLQIIQ